jgi:hypothetical protein
VPSRKQRGHETEHLAADWFAAKGWPHAEAVGAGRPGTDVTGMPGLTVEVKARRGWNVTTWLKQHRHNGTGPITFVVVRPDGYGPAQIADWPVTIRLEEFTQLLRNAGYGGNNGR